MATPVALACANSVFISYPTRPYLASRFLPIPKSAGSLQSCGAPISLKALCADSGFHYFRVNAAGGNPSTKPNSIVCSDCDGNGAIACTQCKGSGVNSVDHFNGQFKAGGSCWLCSIADEQCQCENLTHRSVDFAPGYTALDVDPIVIVNSTFTTLK